MYSKKKLICDLKEYRKIFSPHLLDYLNGAINLEYSVIRDDLLDYDSRNYLNNFDIYRKISLYNICNRTMMLIKDYDAESNISFCDNLDNEMHAFTSVDQDNLLNGISLDFFFCYYNDNECFVELSRYVNIYEEINNTYKKMEQLNYEMDRFDKICQISERYQNKNKYEKMKRHYYHLKKLECNELLSKKIEYVNSIVNMLSDDYKLESKKCLIIKKPGLIVHQKTNHLY